MDLVGNETVTILLTIRMHERVNITSNLIIIENSANSSSSASSASTNASNTSNNANASGYYGSYYSLTFEVKAKCKLY
jgi:hypothetical protein